MKTQLAKFEDKFKTSMRIKGEYEELITKLSENAFMKDKIVKTLAELDRARTQSQQKQQQTLDQVQPLPPRPSRSTIAVKTRLSSGDIKKKKLVLVKNDSAQSEEFAMEAL